MIGSTSGLGVRQADSGQRRQGFGALLCQDRRLTRIDASAWERARSRSRPTIVAMPRPVRLKLSTNSRSVVAVRVVDERHQVGDVQVTAVAPLGIGISSLSRCSELKQTIGRPKYMWYVSPTVTLLTTGSRNSSPVSPSQRLTTRPTGSRPSGWPRSTRATITTSRISLAAMPAAMPQSRSVETVTSTVVVKTKQLLAADVRDVLPDLGRTQLVAGIEDDRPQGASWASG